jgi:hypothetical protein
VLMYKGAGSGGALREMLMLYDTQMQIIFELWKSLLLDLISMLLILSKHFFYKALLT